MRAAEKQLRNRVKQLEQRVSEVEADRDKFREALARNLRNAIRIHGEGKYWAMPNLIETFAKDMQKVERWWW